MKHLAIPALALALCLPLPAQGGCGPNFIEIGQPDGLGGTLWGCQGLPPMLSGKVRLNAPEGSWVQLLPRVYVRNTDPSDPLKVQIEAALHAEFPWLVQQPGWTLDTVLGPAYATQPPVVIDFQTFWMNVFLPLLALDPNDVKKYYQPIVTGTGATRTWQASCPVWTQNPFIPSPPTDMSVLWEMLLVDPAASQEEFDFFSMMQFAALLQGGTDAINFLDVNGKLSDALFVGLHVEFQGIVLESTDPGHVTTGDETTTGGLTGLDNLVLPGLQVTSPVEVTLSQGIPSSGNPQGPVVVAVSPTHVLQVGALNLLPVRRLIPPTGMLLHMPNLPPLLLPLRFHAPGIARVAVPPGLPLGPAWIDVVSPLGTTIGGPNVPWSQVTLTSNTITPTGQ